MPWRTTALPGPSNQCAAGREEGKVVGMRRICSLFFQEVSQEESVAFLNDAGTSTDTFSMEPEHALSTVLGW